ncbi:MAG: multiheme c-type cytochrome [Phycisphaerales bacterium]|jgi:hypothetical protein|nr:hydroxylamine oxidoreductase [Planctomycetaceae bacterium]MDP6158801.1 multiheme c-type cytochrome [Phycisphaerales bacterium]MDP6310646.1 multiheme c-type cytochrome [Phycisphaerales bacterium]MDP7086237.1 multiheme c-type cytochrome [Phycisphaerales bacterium]MDP7188828.1 multiheme c-type cytochrome [Phycisphaerales bacterium]|tara:strand:- start:6192 stop:7673 length:1482 start_codon:yes stop_codon:yes gene_type:complete
MKYSAYLAGIALTASTAVGAITPQTGTPHGTGSTGGAFGLPTISAATKACIKCHKQENPAIYAQWGDSLHFRANIGCFECHSAQEGDVDAFNHHGETISVIVSPRDCARCHEYEVTEFKSSRHAKAALILGSLDNVLAEVVEGNKGMVTESFPMGVSSAAVNGCWQCHGSTVKIHADGSLDPATWPNSGIGRINPDGSEGSCTACHVRHSFSAAQARHPDTCGKCHMGPDHPQKEIYEESKHGILFFANEDEMNLHSPKWIVGEDYSAAPTCATCHMSATTNQPVTHDVGMRISWNNRSTLSVRPEVSDKKLGLPGADVPWQVRRSNMQDVCSSCHNQSWIDNFYTQYDSLIDLYNTKFAIPGKKLYGLAKPLMKPVKFSNKIDFVWFEIWHHEGRRARHGASMMGPDYTHWHGTYVIAKNFYSDFIPELENLVEKGLSSGDDAKVAAAKTLQAEIDKVLHSSDHKWFIGEMDPKEAAARKKAAKEFESRYKK